MKKTLAGWWFQTFFIFTPNPGKMVPFDEHIFQMGWNHHLACCLGYIGMKSYPGMGGLFQK